MIWLNRAKVGMNSKGKNGIIPILYSAWKREHIASALSSALTIYPFQIRVHQRWQSKLQLSGLPTARKKEWWPAIADSLPQAVTCQPCGEFVIIWLLYIHVPPYHNCIYDILWNNKSVKLINIWLDMNKSLELNFFAHPVRQYRLLMFINTGSVSKPIHSLTEIRKSVNVNYIRYIFAYT